LFQGVTITIIAPFYLALQLLGSSSTPQPNALLVDPRDLALLPFSSTITYILPTIGLCLALLDVISGETRLLAIALWQPFPLYHTATRTLAQAFRPSKPANSSKATPFNLREVRKALGKAYGFITVLTVIIHVAVMGTIVASTTTELVSQVSGNHILALTSLTKPPTLAMLNPPVSTIDSREIVVSFLRWDVYCTCASMLIWSAYQLHSIRGSPGIIAIGAKTLFFALVGGPIFPALMLLWERDDLALGEVERQHREHKNGKGSQGQSLNGSSSKGKRRVGA
jgi:hypothetical protein